MAKCKSCGKELTQTDWPTTEYFLPGDVEWGIKPTREDPGWLVPKEGRLPHDQHLCGLGEL